MPLSSFFFQLKYGLYHLALCNEFWSRSFSFVSNSFLGKEAFLNKDVLAGLILYVLSDGSLIFFTFKDKMLLSVDGR